MGSSKKEIPIADYRLSAHMGMALGPISALLELRIKDKIAWPAARVGMEDEDINVTKSSVGIGLYTGRPPMAEPAILSINEPDLFGGDQGGGGVVGIAEFLPGRDDQTLSASAAARFGLTPETSPGFRGVASVMFYGGDVSGDVTLKPGQAGAGSKVYGQRGLGFRWGTNDPFMPEVSARIVRHPDHWGPNASLISVDRYAIFRDDQYIGANPAAIIQEILTGGAMGVELNPMLLDADSFRRAERVLAKEKLGLSFHWTEGNVRRFLSTILDHIGGDLSVNPDTGRFSLRLLRSDADLRLFKTDGVTPDTGYASPANTDLFRSDLIINPDNARLIELRRRGWGDLVTTLHVTYTDRNTGEQVGVTVHNDQAIAMQGRQVARTRDLSGIQDPQTAMEVGLRELTALSTPALSADLEMGRAALTLRKFDVVPMIWPGEKVETLVRITDIDYGKPGAATVKVTVAEDVLGMVRRANPTLDRERWNSGKSITHIHQGYVTSAPYAVLVRSGLPAANLGELVDSGDNYPMHLIDTPSSSGYCRILSGEPGVTKDADLATFGTLQTTAFAEATAGWQAEDFTTSNVYEMQWSASRRPFAVGDHLVVVRADPIYRAKSTIPGAGENLSVGEASHIFPEAGPDLEGHLVSLGAGVFKPDTYSRRLAGAAAALFEGVDWGKADVRYRNPLEGHSGVDSGLAALYPEEWIRVDAFDAESGAVTLRRGIYDTTPAPVRPGDKIYHVPAGHVPFTAVGTDGETRSIGYRPQTMGTVSKFVFGYADQTLDERIQRPTRPANVKLTVQGPGGGGTISRGKITLTGAPTMVRIAFSARDKRVDDAAAPAWSSNGIAGAPPCKIRLWKRRRTIAPGSEALDESVLSLETSIAVSEDGPNYVRDIPLSFFLPDDTPGSGTDMPGRDSYIIEVLAEDGLDSWQNPIVGLDIVSDPGGYGRNYGRSYGVA